MDALKPVVLLEAFYRRGTAGVPCPADGESVDWWWDHLAKQANELSKVGFTAIWLPPVNKGLVGTSSVGYDVFDDYDLGSNNTPAGNQKPSYKLTVTYTAPQIHT